MRAIPLSPSRLRYAGLLLSMLLAVSCEDPPPPPDSGAFILGIRTVLPPVSNPTLGGGQRENLEGLSGLKATVYRVEMVHRTVADDPSTEQLILVDDVERPFEFLGDLRDQAPRQLGFFNVPKGFVFQIRVFARDALITLRGETHPVRIPSVEQTGIKIEPLDGAPFEIVAGERRGARIVFNPFEQLLRNKGQGFMMKPVLLAEAVTLEELSPILLDRAVVRFKAGVTQAQVDALNAGIGATVIDFDRDARYYVVRLPVSITLADALQYYADRSEVDFTLPDTLVHYRQVTPCDPQFQNPGPFTQVNAPQAWTVTQGSRRALLAVIDNGFDLANPDMVNNYFINPGELTGVAFFDTDGDGTVTQAELLGFDTDGDGVITFVDLNAPANAGLCGGGGGLTCDRDGDGVVTPLDLVDGNAGTNVGFENGLDDDGNGRADDLIGWDFANNDNLPANPGTNGCLNAHGVGVAGIVAAIGSPPPTPPAVCASGLVAGMNWIGRLVPIQNGRLLSGLDTASRSGSYLAIRYAVGLGADAINASWGITYTRGGDPGCNLAISGLGDKFDELLPPLASEGASLALGNSLLIAAVDNCAQNNDSGDIFDWPSELGDGNILAVAALQTLASPPALAGFSAFGSGAVDIAAPGTNHVVLDRGGGTNTCQGTSFATPLVTGTVGLLIAQTPALQGDAATLRSRLLCNATVAAGLSGQIGGGGRVLDVNNSVTNANACP